MKPKPQAKYVQIALTSIKETLYYPQKLWGTMLVIPTRILVLILIYHYAFSYIGGSINGITTSITIWSIAVYQFLLLLQFRGIFRTINYEIRTGAIEVQLNKPYHYLFYKVCEQFGKNIPNLLVTFLSVLPLLLLIIGFPQQHLSLETVFGGVVLILGGTVLSAVLYLLIVLPALWIDDAEPLFWIVDKAILILGGSYIPIALLPQSVQMLANSTPFGAPMFATQMFNPTFADRWEFLFLIQLFWIVIMLLAVHMVFRKAQTRLSVNGG